MRKTFVLASLAVMALAALPAEAQYRPYGADHALRFRVGLFTPEGDSSYWQDLEEVFDGDVDEFEDLDLGIDFRYGLGEHFGLLFSGDFYEGQDDLAYRDFTDGGGRDIFHTTTLDVTALTAAAVFNLTGRGARVVPYVGAGGGLYAWTLQETGDFIDFSDPDDLFLFTGTFEDSGEALGWFGLVGVEVLLGPQWAVFAEGRWQQVDDELAGDFAGLGDLDLSGRQIHGGFSWRF